MSTIKVDTYLTRGGASEIAIDKLKGASSASSISVVGEGGTTTTNLQQGLAKVWIQAVGAGTSYNDSFNSSSLTDVGTGNIRVTYTNNMSNDDSAFTLGHQYQSLSGTSAFATNAGAMTTSTHEHSHYQNGALADPVKYSGAIHGDLA